MAKPPESNRQIVLRAQGLSKVYGMGEVEAAQVAGSFCVRRNVVQVAASWPVGWLAGIFFIAGLYIAVQEAVQSTVTADRVPAKSLSIGIGAFGTVDVLPCATESKVWTAVSPVLAFALAAGFMLADTLAVLRVPD